MTKLPDSHMAEARIVEDKYGDPIITGDVIYTPVWRPGQQRHFALAGIMDINGDNKSELDLVRRLITMNGGVVDAIAEGDMKSERHHGQNGLPRHRDPSRRLLVPNHAEELHRHPDGGQPLHRQANRPQRPARPDGLETRDHPAEVWPRQRRWTSSPSPVRGPNR